MVVTGAGLEAPLATMHELRTIYTLEDFYNFLNIMSNHSIEMKAEYDRISRG